jgi:hypothetical protein
MQKIYAVYYDAWDKASEFYSTPESAQKALETIVSKYGYSELYIREFFVYDYNMEDN